MHRQWSRMTVLPGKSDFMTLDSIIDGIIARKEDLSATNQQIADASNVSLSTVNRILRKQEGYIPNIQTLLDIATAVGYDFAPAEQKPVETDDAVLNHIIQVYENRCSDLERESRLKTVQYNMIVAEKTKWIKFLTVLSLVLVAGIILVLLYDVTHPNIGWIQGHLTYWGH